MPEERAGFVLEDMQKFLDDRKYKCIRAYIAPDEPSKWLSCPSCGLKPKVWSFDNGRSTACGCGKDDYDHFRVCAESIMSHIKNNGSCGGYDCGELMKNWNHWVETGEFNFIPNHALTGRW